MNGMNSTKNSLGR